MAFDSRAETRLLIESARPMRILHQGGGERAHARGGGVGGGGEESMPHERKLDCSLELAHTALSVIGLIRRVLVLIQLEVNGCWRVASASVTLRRQPTGTPDKVFKDN